MSKSEMLKKIVADAKNLNQALCEKKCSQDDFNRLASKLSDDIGSMCK